VLPHTAVDLVLGVGALGHRVLIAGVVLRGSRPPLSRTCRNRQVLAEATGKTAGRETLREPKRPAQRGVFSGKAPSSQTAGGHFWAIFRAVNRPPGRRRSRPSRAAASATSADRPAPVDRWPRAAG